MIEVCVRKVKLTGTESRQKNEESRRLQNENDVLKSQLQDKDKVIKDSKENECDVLNFVDEMLLAKAKEWENSVEALKQKQKGETHKLQNQFNVDLQKKQLEVDSLNQELAEKRKLEGKLKWAHEQLANSVRMFLRFLTDRLTRNPIWKLRRKWKDSPSLWKNNEK